MSLGPQEDPARVQQSKRGIQHVFDYDDTFAGEEFFQTDCDYSQIANELAGPQVKQPRFDHCSLQPEYAEPAWLGHTSQLFDQHPNVVHVADKPVQQGNHASYADPFPAYSESSCLNTFPEMADPLVESADFCSASAYNGLALHSLASKYSSYTSWPDTSLGTDFVTDVRERDAHAHSPANDGIEGSDGIEANLLSIFQTDCIFHEDLMNELLTQPARLPPGLDGCASGNMRPRASCCSKPPAPEARPRLSAPQPQASTGLSTVEALPKGQLAQPAVASVKLERKITCRTYCKRLHVTQNMADKLLPVDHEHKAKKKPLTNAYELLFKYKLELVDEEGFVWPVEYEGVICCSQRHLRLTSGWRQFVQSKNIQVGDVVCFERQGNNRYRIGVKVIRNLLPE